LKFHPNGMIYIDMVYLHTSEVKSAFEYDKRQIYIFRSLKNGRTSGHSPNRVHTQSRNMTISVSET